MLIVKKNILYNYIKYELLLCLLQNVMLQNIRYLLKYNSQFIMINFSYLLDLSILRILFVILEMSNII